MDKERRARYLIQIKKGILAECILVMLAAVGLVAWQNSVEESRRSEERRVGKEC